MIKTEIFDKLAKFLIYHMPTKKLTKIDKFNVVLGIFNLIGVIVAISISIWGIKKSEDIAEKSGAFDKGSLLLSFGGVFVEPNQEFDAYFGMKLSDTSLHFIELPISIYNDGKKTVENANLMFKYLHIFNIALSDSVIQYDAGNASKIERTLRTNLPYDQVSIAMNSINPNVSVSPSEFIFARKGETGGEVKVSGYTKDSVLINAVVKYTYNYPVTISLMGKDIVSKVYQVNINYREEANLESLLRKVLNEKKKLRNKGKSNWSNSFFVIIPKVKEVVGDKSYKLTFMNSNEDSILLCHFDVNKEHVVIFTPDGNAKQIIDF